MPKRKRSDPPVGTVQFKTIEFDTKAVAAEPDADGMVYIEGYGSVFDNIDSHNDMIVKGAYSDTLKAWDEKGAPIPSYYNHGAFSNDPMDNVGFLSVATEDDHGLKITMALDVGHNEKAAYAHRLVKQGRLREFSVGYIAKSWELIHEEGKREWEYTRKLTALDLLEVSLVSIASNPLATVTAKAASLLYGVQDEDDPGEKDGDDEGQEQEEKAELDADALTELLGALTEAKDSFMTAFDAVVSAITEAIGDEDGDDESGADEDDPGQEAGEKSGKLSLKARATLAMIALNGADKENAR